MGQTGLAHTAYGPIFCSCEAGSDEAELGLAMVVVAMMMVMRSRGERRTGEHHDQEHSSKNLLHGLNLA